MILPDLVNAVATSTSQPKSITEQILKAALEQIEAAVAEGQEVNLVGFGRFEVYERGARQGRNLRTGQTLSIPATKAVRFKAGKRLKDAAAGGGTAKKPSAKRAKS
jgi:DNA-binding protein HU-beta